MSSKRESPALREARKNKERAKKLAVDSLEAVLDGAVRHELRKLQALGLLVALGVAIDPHGHLTATCIVSERVLP